MQRSVKQELTECALAQLAASVRYNSSIRDRGASLPDRGTDEPAADILTAQA